jgi:hypothetical protein
MIILSILLLFDLITNSTTLMVSTVVGYPLLFPLKYLIVYPDGRLCISILHPPGEDPVSGEKAEVINETTRDVI